MSTSAGPNISLDGLVFGYDTGYPIVDNNTATRFNKGEPTVNSLASTNFGYSGITLGTDEGGTYLETNSGTTGYNYIKVPNITVSSNETYTWSFELKSEETITQSGNKYYFDTNEYSNEFSNSNDLSRVTWNQIRPSSLIAGEWVKFSLSVTMKPNLTGAYSYDFLNFIKPHFTSKKIYYRNMQFEHNKSHHTPFVDGTRSSTGSLIDLKETTDIDVSNASFDSTGQPTFDGTDDYLDLGNSSVFDFGQTGTIEAVLKPTNSTGNSRIWCIDNNSSNLDAYLNSSGYNVYLHGGTVGTTTPLTQNQYNHLVVRYDNGTIQIYINGVAGTMTGTTTGYNILNNSGNNSNLYLGCYRNLSYNFPGEMPIFRVYNSALNVNEIAQNFNAYKNRLGI